MTDLYRDDDDILKELEFEDDNEVYRIREQRMRQLKHE